MYWVTTAVFVVLIFHVSCVSQIVLEQVPRLRIDRARLIKEAKQDMWEMFDSKAEVFIQCSSDGGETWPMRVDLESVDSVGRWYEGPWELGEWKYEYGSILYCQVLEDDQALPNFFSFFDTIIDPNDLMGDTVIFMSSGQTLGVKAQRFRGHTSPHRMLRIKISLTILLVLTYPSLARKNQSKVQIRARNKSRPASLKRLLLLGWKLFVNW
eukprot:TRINITY_DN2710_c1_g1_i3.p1 TRINITY_DN2710_c1_g1~~TRINITY_DN2710_c1_g1_i3.p1  ORF type:complete len:211 (-),score=25.21 TRINITY_DN2710_c1_g1_i3:486-1118(-)